MTAMTDDERALLQAWWDSEWPRDGSNVLDGLAGVLDRIIDARLGSGEVVEAVAEAITESPNGAWLTLPGPVSIAPSIAAAAVEAVRAALKEGE